MRLHIFNPEHDIALAAHLANFTAPHAGRQLRCDLGFLPALWADEGDAVLVDCLEVARRRYNRLRSRVGGPQPLFVEKDQLARMDITEVCPWGWDRALRAQLLRWGVGCVPSDDYIEQVHRLSHRRQAARLLTLLRQDGTIGEAFECRDAAEVETLLQRYGQVVMKAPWSSSGRGLRFLDVSRTPFQMQANWFANIVRSQGSVMVEPLYPKVKDFGMEFMAHSNGQITYEGLSLFHTANGAYTGNLLASEDHKQSVLTRYIPARLLDSVKQSVISSLDLEDYCGPFGIDMMVVAGSGAQPYLLHPCVEINLRRTMGHVALSLTPADDVVKVMRILLQDHYKLSIRKL